VLTTVLVGDGSAQTSPNHAFDVHLWCLVALGVALLVGSVGGDVIGCDIVEVVVVSLHPQNQPGVSHSIVVVEDGGVVGVGEVVVEVGVKAPVVLVVVVVVLS
jgi:hypothetical protein